MTNSQNALYRALFALFTAAALVVTFYFPLVGLGGAMNSSADLQSRGESLLWFLPSFAILILLLGMVLPIRGRRLFWLGVGGNLLILPSIIACAWLGPAAIIGALVGLGYLAIWWLLARGKLSLTSAQTSG